MSIINKSDKIVIIGATGYIGSKLTQEIKLIYSNVALIDSSYFYNSFNSLKKKDIELLYDADIIYYLTFNNDLKFAEKNSKIHFKQTIVPLNKVLLILQSKDITTKFIFTSTVTLYGNSKKLIINEKNNIDPISIYDYHKSLAEKLILDAAKISFIAPIILRLSNIYGYSLNFSKSSNRGIVNYMVNQSLVNKKINLYGNGDYLRDFLYISDVIDLLIISANTNSKYNIFNLCNGNSFKLIAMANMIKEIIFVKNSNNINIDFINWPEDSLLIEKRNFICNNSLICKEFNWHPKIALFSGLKLMIEEKNLLND